MAHPKPTQSSPKPLVTILVPAFKEAEYIEATLEGIVRAFRQTKIFSEILVILDRIPSDETVTHVRKASKKYHEIRVIEREGRRGVGDAIRTGIKEANGTIIIPVMGDQSERPGDIVKLAQRAQGFDVVFTNRFIGGRPSGYPAVKYLANRSCNYAVKWLFRLPYSDVTNAFKAYKKHVLDRIVLSSTGFEIFLEIPLKALKLGGLKTDEVKVDHIARKKKSPKLSIVRDGYRYAKLMLLQLKCHASMKTGNPHRLERSDLEMDSQTC